MRKINRPILLLFSIAGAVHSGNSIACKIETLIAWKDHGIFVGVYRQPADQGSDISASGYDPQDDNFPRALTVDSKGTVYFGDSIKYRVLRVSKAGKLLKTFILRRPTLKAPVSGYVIGALAVDDKDNLYVLNSVQGIGEVYDPTGKLIRVIPNLGGKPDALYVGGDGNVYVFNGGLSGVHSQTAWLDISRVNGYEPRWKSKLLVNYSGLHFDSDTNTVVRDDGFVVAKCKPRPLIAEWYTQTLVDKNAVATVIASNTFNILRVVPEPEDLVRTK